MEEKTATTEGDSETEGEDCGILEAQVLSLCHVVMEHCAEFIRHTHGSHVARTLIHVLAGCLGPARTDTARPGTHIHAHNYPNTLIHTITYLDCVFCFRCKGQECHHSADLL